MAEANQAYERGDQARLAKILTAYEHSPEAVEGEGPGAELIRVIRRVSQARGRLAEIEAEMQGLLRSDLHQLKSRVDEAEKSGHDVLKEMIAKVDEQIALAKQRLENPAPLSPLMETQEKSPAKQIVRAPAQALAVRSAAMVTRGLRDLARDSNWLIKKVFNGRSSHLVISPAGEVCALSPLVRQGTERIALYDIELRRAHACARRSRRAGSFVRRACPPRLRGRRRRGTWLRHGAAGCRNCTSSIFTGKFFSAAFGDFAEFSIMRHWSEHREIFCCCFARRRGRRGCDCGRRQRQDRPRDAVCRRAWLPNLARPALATIGLSRNQWTRNPATKACSPVSAAPLSARTKASLASVVEIEGEWADDSIVSVGRAHAATAAVIPAQGRVTDCVDVRQPPADLLLGRPGVSSRDRAVGGSRNRAAVSAPNSAPAIRICRSASASVRGSRIPQKAACSSST